ncbi:hypothetical protein K1719_008396 [Acacia pycnantha]|nr:hypothetical protein K1719_008396 [Acacia pycnantha]
MKINVREFSRYSVTISAPQAFRLEVPSLKICFKFRVQAPASDISIVKDAHVRSSIDGLLDILKNMLTYGEISSEIHSSLVDKAHLRLASAKAVLRLSRQWDHKIPIGLFYWTLETSKVKAIDEEMRTGFLGIGFQPKWGLKDIPIMPKSLSINEVVSELDDDYIEELGELDGIGLLEAISELEDISLNQNVGETVEDIWFNEKVRRHFGEGDCHDSDSDKNNYMAWSESESSDSEYPEDNRGDEEEENSDYGGPLQERPSLRELDGSERRSYFVLGMTFLDRGRVKSWL